MTNRVMDVVGFLAVMSVAGGVFIAGFPWAGLLWTSLIVCVAHAMFRRTSDRSMAQLLSEVEAEPLGPPVRVTVPVPRRPSDR